MSLVVSSHRGLIEYGVTGQVGSAMKTVLSELGILPTEDCPCLERMTRMNHWGPEGCRENRELILHWFRSEYESWGWGAKFRTAVRAMYTGLAFKLNPIDPFPGLLDEALRRASPPTGKA